MKVFLKTMLALIALLVVAAGAIYFTGNALNVAVMLGKPHHGWDVSLKAPPPDYSQSGSWAALPGKRSPADFVPAGVPVSAKDREVDVFFVHPTGYMHGTDWNSPLDPNSETEENTKWMMANQASAFNGCCAVYAPRYREASIFRYFTAPPADLVKKTMNLAYSDVDRAFSYFLDHYSRGRPFIIASHSQGTDHALRLIRERIDGTPLAARMVAAYIIGGRITDREISGLKTVRACNSATDLHCIIHWMTFGEGATLNAGPHDKYLCTNPLTWERDGARAAASLHKGGVPESGRFQVDFFRPDVASRMVFPPLRVPYRAWTWAECRNGLLFVADQKDGPFDDGLDFGVKNYHTVDYSLFHMDIRENAEARVAAYLAARGTAPSPGHK